MKFCKDCRYSKIIKNPILDSMNTDFSKCYHPDTMEKKISPVTGEAVFVVGFPQYCESMRTFHGLPYTLCGADALLFEPINLVVDNEN